MITIEQLKLFDVPEAEPQAGTRSKNVRYKDFVEKFKPKKTTDECYTPPDVYDAISDWVRNEYSLDGVDFLRPFYPGGDYKNFDYPVGCVVVDNPPFSILAQILDFYQKHKIRYFLFAPTLTLFSKAAANYTCLPVGVTVTYENGAEVNTSFVTNLEEPDIKVRSVPKLYKAVKAANKKNIKAIKKQLPKYIYPDNVLTAAAAYQYSRLGIDYVLRDCDCVKIEALDAQRAKGKAIFGKGFLLSEHAAAERAAAERAAAERAAAERAAAEGAAAERAAAERAAAERWELSDRELAIIKSLGHPAP